MISCLMPLPIDDSKSTHLFFRQPEANRTCFACGEAQRYKFNSSGRYFYVLDGLRRVAGQIVYCHNGRCPLRFKPIHPPEELALAPQQKGHGYDVIACIGQMRFRDKLTRSEIGSRLAKDFPRLVVSDRQIETLYKMYGALVSGTTLQDPAVIQEIKRNKAIVLSLDGAKPIKDHESVWFVRDLISGVTLAALAMRSCTKAALVRLLTPIKKFARSVGVPIVGVVSDAESKVRSAVKQVFPRVRHQLCQFHYVGNLAAPVVAQDRKLHKDIKESLPELGQVERQIQADTEANNGSSLSKPQASVLLDLCETIRSILRRTGKPPFDPPGLRLFQELTELRQAAQEMRKRKKGGPICRRSSIFSRWSRSSVTTRSGSVGSMRTSVKSATSSSSRRRQPTEPSVSCVR